MRRKHWLALFVLLVIVVAIIVSVHAVSTPSHGRATSSLSAKVKLSSTRQKQSIVPASDTQNAYFNLMLPAGYKQQSSNTDTPGLLYQQTIIKTLSSGSLVVAIALAPLGSGLSENTAYNLRIHNPARYKMATRTIQDESVVIANDTQSAAVTAFWVHSDKLATISVSSGLQDAATDNNAEETKALQPLLEAWQWR